MPCRRKLPSFRGRSWPTLSDHATISSPSDCSLGSLRVINTLNLDQTGVWIGVALASLVAEVLAPDLNVSPLSLSLIHI